jgi:hypothetical protein
VRRCRIRRGGGIAVDAAPAREGRDPDRAVAPVLLWQHPVRRVIVMCALALAVGPAIAAQSDRPAASVATEQRLAVPLPVVQTSWVGTALESLRRLRIHPGERCLDPTETTRARPEQASR